MFVTDSLSIHIPCPNWDYHFHNPSFTHILEHTLHYAWEMNPLNHVLNVISSTTVVSTDVYKRQTCHSAEFGGKPCHCRQSISLDRVLFFCKMGEAWDGVSDMVHTLSLIHISSYFQDEQNYSLFDTIN